MKLAEVWRVLWGCLLLTLLLYSVTVSAQAASTNNWIKPASGNWDDPSAWSLGRLPTNSQSVLITNSVWKAVAINPSTPVNFPGSMTVRSLTVGAPTDTVNTLLLNFFGSTRPLHVLNRFNIEPNGRLVMLHSGLRVDNVLNVKGTFEQEGGDLVVTNSFIQIEGGRFNLTNGVVKGSSMYLGGTNDGYMDQGSGLVSLDSLVLGSKPSVPGAEGPGTYLLQNGWLIVGVDELVGQSGFGTFHQWGGTNSARNIICDNGVYVKTGGALFAGEVIVVAVNAFMTHAGGTATISNVLRLVGGDRLNPSPVWFYMHGGSLSTPRIELQYGGTFLQTNGTVNVARELFIEDAGELLSSYYLDDGNLFAANTTLSSAHAKFFQSGGTYIVTNQLRISGYTWYRLSGGTVNASNIVLTGNLDYSPLFQIEGAPAFAITNDKITLSGGFVRIQDSAQQFGRLTLPADSGINLDGDSAILRFADSHTNSWASESLGGVPRLLVYNWNGSPNGGGADQLRFGNSSSALTPGQLARIKFVNAAGFVPGTNSARILATGEVVPVGVILAVGFSKQGNNLVLTWPSGWFLQRATNVVGPYLDFLGTTSPYSNNMTLGQQQFFRLRR